MRLAILVNQLSGGGAERQAALWAEICAELGHRVTVLSARRQQGQFALGDDVELRYADKRGRLDVLRVSRAIRSLAREVDAMVAFQYYPAVFAAFPGVAVPWMVVTGDDPRYHWDGHDMPRFVIKRAFGRAAVASAPARGLVDCYREHGVKPRGGWLQVPNVAADESFTATSSPRAGALFVGRLIEQKDPLLAVEVAQRAGAKMTVLGRGALEAEVARRAAQALNGADVRLEAFTPEPWAAYARHRVLLLTSRFEPFGNVVVESLAAGTPVVAADCDFGPREILAGATFSHVVPREPEALAEALRTVLERPYGEDEARECREIASRYSKATLKPEVEKALAATVAGG
jgi:glycosyltransferase involved in cell wall biosynthesis